MIKLVISDLDGTLVNSDEIDYEVSNDLIEMIKLLTDKGILFTIATGRPYISAQPIVDKLNLQCPYIAYNGGQLIGENGEKLFESYLDIVSFREVIKEVNDLGFQVLVYDDNHAFCLDYNTRIQEYEYKEKIKCHVISQEEMLKIRSSKLLFLGDVKLIKEIISQKGDIQQKYKMMQSEEDYLEIVQKELNKGKTLCKLIDYLNITGKVLSIGNHMNDVELLNEAHIGIAVNNATKELKQIADYVTKESYEKGVMEVISRFILKEDKDEKFY